MDRLPEQFGGSVKTSPAVSHQDQEMFLGPFKVGPFFPQCFHQALFFGCQLVELTLE